MEQVPVDVEQRRPIIRLPNRHQFQKHTIEYSQISEGNPQPLGWPADLQLNHGTETGWQLMRANLSGAPACVDKHRACVGLVPFAEKILFKDRDFFGDCGSVWGSGPTWWTRWSRKILS